MTRVATIYIVISFVSVAVFGFLGISFMNDHHAACIVSTSSGAACPGDSPISFINFHLNALKNFSTAVFSGNLFAGLLFLALALLFVRLGWLTASSSARAVAIPRYFGQPIDRFSAPLKFQLVSWLSLLEFSPPCLS
jgi:hypothetical protein